jgi:hypothetical protein
VSNLYRALLELLPQTPLLVATVISVSPSNGTSVIEYPGGDQQTVRGIDVSTGNQVFVRNGVIEGAAPSLSAVTIEV